MLVNGETAIIFGAGGDRHCMLDPPFHAPLRAA
jgi:hypothetical protein